MNGGEAQRGRGTPASPERNLPPHPAAAPPTPIRPTKQQKQPTAKDAPARAVSLAALRLEVQWKIARTTPCRELTQTSPRPPPTPPVAGPSGRGGGCLSDGGTDEAPPRADPARRTSDGDSMGGERRTSNRRADLGRATNGHTGTRRGRSSHAGRPPEGERALLRREGGAAPAATQPQRRTTNRQHNPRHERIDLTNPPPNHSAFRSRTCMSA